MKITGTTYGKTRDGERIDIVTISNSSDVSFSVISYGATLISVKSPDKNGSIDELTLGKADLAAYEAGHPFFGSTVGRFGNRIADASFTIDGEKYQLTANNGPNSLHGGPGGFHTRVWDIFPFKEDDRAGVRFTYVSEDGEEGFPGKLEITSTYVLNEDNELFFDYEAITDKATPLNITNHVYWNLDGAGEGTILDHDIKLNCKKYLPVNDVQIPVGELRDVDGTPFDFTEEKRIGNDIEAAGGYDHCWVTDKWDSDADGIGTEAEAAAVKATTPFAVLSSKKSGRKLEFHTSQPGVQFYTGNFLDGESGRAGSYEKNYGLCLETQNFPDSPNQSNFPSPVLKPGKKYVHSTMIRFSTT